MAESRAERELRDNRRSLESLNSRDLGTMELQRRAMATWENDDRPSAITRYNAAKARLEELDALVTGRIVEIDSIKTKLLSIENEKKEKEKNKEIEKKQKELKYAQDTLL